MNRRKRRFKHHPRRKHLLRLKNVSLLHVHIWTATSDGQPDQFITTEGYVHYGLGVIQVTGDRHLPLNVPLVLLEPDPPYRVIATIVLRYGYAQYGFLTEELRGTSLYRKIRGISKKK